MTCVFLAPLDAALLVGRVHYLLNWKAPSTGMDRAEYGLATRRTGIGSMVGAEYNETLSIYRGVMHSSLMPALLVETLGIENEAQSPRPAFLLKADYRGPWWCAAGDGMVTALTIRGGECYYRQRYMRGEKFLAQVS